MADLITIAEYEQAGGDPAAYGASLAIAAASDKVRDYLHQTISLVEGDVVTLIGTGTRAILLPELPVVAINSITVNDETLTAADWYENRGVLYRLASETGCVTIWPLGATIVVDYDHGYATIPALIRMVTARLAVNGARSAGVKQESAQDYSVTYDDATNSDAAELAVLNRRVVRQVPVP